MPAVKEAEFNTGSEAETEEIGRTLAAELASGGVVLLFGELGTGKTCFVRGLAAGLGIDPERVHSPTFVMVMEHAGPRPLHHADLYRLRPGEDFSDLGLAELFAGDGITAVEWAERLPPSILPAERTEVHLSHAGENRRRIRITRPGSSPGPATPPPRG